MSFARITLDKRLSVCCEIDHSLNPQRMSLAMDRKHVSVALFDDFIASSTIFVLARGEEYHYFYYHLHLCSLR